MQRQRDKFFFQGAINSLVHADCMPPNIEPLRLHKSACQIYNYSDDPDLINSCVSVSRWRQISICTSIYTHMS